MSKRWNVVWCVVLGTAILGMGYLSAPVMSVLIWVFVHAPLPRTCPPQMVPDSAMVEYAGPAGLLWGFFGGLALMWAYHDITEAQK